MAKGLMVSFRDEVLRKGLESTLPCNLSDKWLGVLAAQLEAYFEQDVEDALSLPLAAVLHILCSKSGGEAVTVSQDRLFEHLCDYRIELGLEEIRRKTEMGNEPVSLQAIFTNRTVTFRGAGD
ncbi:hypothetical protein [Pseudomonas kulmbachensis]|uniref:hypothetical protein n=1 Tax=Pseudomonas kulmbachensis TaxID=3043408 RepID=UPI002AAFD643|nr:hypothetical protein [Pseudomonas sp. FLM 004-28]